MKNRLTVVVVGMVVILLSLGIVAKILNTGPTNGIQAGHALRPVNDTYVFSASLKYRSTLLLDLTPWQYSNYSNTTVVVTKVGLAGASRGVSIRTQFRANLCITNPPFESVEDYPDYRLHTYGKVYPPAAIVVIPNSALPKNSPTTKSCYLHSIMPIPKFINFVVVQLPGPGKYIIRGFKVTYRSMGRTYQEILPGIYRITAVS
jgi:hypothetical protein